MVKKILFASTDMDFGHIAEMFQQRTGFVYDVFRTGTDLLERIKEDKPDLIVIDRDLSGVGGDEITLSVKNDNDLKKIPVMILVSEDKSEILERCLLSGCDDYLIKPPDEQILVNKMARLLKIPFRRDLRILFRFWVQGKTLSHYFFGNSKDISASGMLFTTDVKLNIGDIIEVTFFIPASTRKIATTCKIVRTVNENEDEDDFSYGVQFLQMEKQSTINLKDYLEKVQNKP